MRVFLPTILFGEHPCHGGGPLPLFPWYRPPAPTPHADSQETPSLSSTTSAKPTKTAGATGGNNEVPQPLARYMPPNKGRTTQSTPWAANGSIIFDSRGNPGRVESPLRGGTVSEGLPFPL